MKHYRFIATLFILAVLVGACNLPDGTNISEADAVRFAQETLQAQIDAGEVQLQEQAAPPPEQAPEEQIPADQPPADSSISAATATDTPIAATSTITLTPTLGTAIVSVSTATNCRTGPGVPYAINGSLSPGQTGIVAAQASVNNYVLIQNPSGGPNCWLWLQYATITGDISGLPVVTPPPSPTPTFTPTFTPTITPLPIADWTGTWTTKIEFAGSETILTVTLNQSGSTVSGSGGGYTFTGTTSGPGGATLSGSWLYTPSSGAGNFTWQMVSGTSNQFRGINDVVWAGTMWPWCGQRSGAGYPSPCLGP